MGDKRVSTRTLPSGEQVLHHPPDDKHPDGKMVLIHHDALKEKMAQQRDEKRERHQAMRAAHRQRIDFKIARQQAGGLPGEKSPI